jgi:hypothetical protein
MAPCDFRLFPRLKTPLQGFHLDSREGAAEHHSKTSLPEVLPVMEGPLG